MRELPSMNARISAPSTVSPSALRLAATATSSRTRRAGLLLRRAMRCAVGCAAVLVAMSARAEGMAGLGEAPSWPSAASRAPVADHAEDGTAGAETLEPLTAGAFGGVGFPRPLAIEAMIKIDKVVGIGFAYSLLPSATIAGVDTTFYAACADVRRFPFRNGFFVGIAGGHQHVSAATTVTLPGGLGSLAESVTADTWLINPRIGYLSTWDSAFTLGIDAGVQIPLSATIANTIPSSLAVSQSAEDAARFLGKSVIPTVDLLRIGRML
jgi:hypothetical protein